MGSNAADQSSATFDTLASGLDYPMVVVSVASGADRSGCLVGFSTKCSIDPARYAVCISKRNRTADVAARTATMVVHFLRANDKALARLFGEETDDEIPKFDRCSWHPGPDDTPVIADCDWFGGRIAQRIDVGDHILHVLDVIDAGISAPVRLGQLGFQAVKDLDPGPRNSTPCNASTRTEPVSYVFRTPSASTISFVFTQTSPLDPTNQAALSLRRPVGPNGLSGGTNDCRLQRCSTTPPTCQATTPSLHFPNMRT